jgi:hypothetical protein
MVFKGTIAIKLHLVAILKSSRMAKTFGLSLTEWLIVRLVQIENSIINTFLTKFL